MDMIYSQKLAYAGVAILFCTLLISKGCYQEEVADWGPRSVPTTKRFEEHLQVMYSDWKAGRIKRNFDVPVCGTKVSVDILDDTRTIYMGFSKNVFNAEDFFLKTEDYQIYSIRVQGEHLYYFILDKKYAWRLHIPSEYHSEKTKD